MDKQQFGAFVAEHRKRQGLTQQKLSQQLYVTDRAVSKWERGLSYPDVTLLEPLAAALGLRPEELLTCRVGEKEEPLQEEKATNYVPIESGETAVSAVVSISKENTRQRRKSFYRVAIGLAVPLVLLVLLVVQRNGLLLKAHRVETPNGVYTLSFYGTSPFSDTVCVKTDASLTIGLPDCAYCGHHRSQQLNGYALSRELTYLQQPKWSADGRYLMLYGTTRRITAPAYLTVWDWSGVVSGKPVAELDVATEVLVQLSGYGDPDAPTAPLLPALDGVSETAFLPEVELSAPLWVEDSHRLAMLYSYEGTDGVTRQGRLTYDMDSGKVVSVVQES